MHTFFAYNGIVLGPLLGIESDEDYTICVLIEISNFKDINGFSINIDGLSIKSSKKITLIDKYFYLRFEFKKPGLPDKYQFIQYSVNYNDTPLKTCNNHFIFSFRIPPANCVPSICFVSCNGTDIYPNDVPLKHYEGWEKLLDVSPDFLIMGGDQIYADSILDKIHGIDKYFKDLKIPIPPNIIRQIELFYLKLYINSWSNNHMALALATIPNIMTWDDHDIFDGYGSYKDEFQSSSIITVIFNSAKFYYELFQLRTIENKTLYEWPFCGTQLKLRNYWIICPDTRINRTRTRILSSEQYSNLDALLKSNIINNKTVNNVEGTANSNFTICFVLPVPIAHRNYFSIMDQISSLNIYSKKSNILKNLKFSNNDDLRDHWDHYDHRTEQLKMLNLIFDFGILLHPKYLLILSGDVHSSGASSISKHDNGTVIATATQLVSSPIVNKPITSILNTLFAWLSRDKNRLEGFELDFKNFGTYKRKNIIKRNFIKVSQIENKSLNASIYVEENSGWKNNKPEFRNLNKFK